MRYVELDRSAGQGAALQSPLAPDLIEGLCQRAFGRGARMVSAQLQSLGRFNTTYRVGLENGRQVILRVAPPPSAILFAHEQRLLRRECAVHAALAGAVAQVPRLLFQDFSGELIPRDYVFLEYLPGRLWDEVRGEFSPQEEASLWRQLGGLVRAIHGVVGPAYGPPAVLHGRWSQAVLVELDGLIADLEILGLDGQLARRFRSLTAGQATVLDRSSLPRLIHGDLWPKNILVDRIDGRLAITGLLDGERARWGDPAAEWIFGFLDIPPAFWSAYGRDLSEAALAPEAKIRRHVYNGRGALQLMLEAWRWGLDDGFARRLLAEAVDGLEHAPDHLALAA